MEFDDEHEEQEGEIGMNNSGARKIAGGGVGGATGSVSGATTPTIPATTYRYRECLKNHAVGIGGNAVDGCGEFMAAGADGTLESLNCAACSCHRNFHRKEAEGLGEAFYQHHQQPPHPPPHHHHPHLATAYSFRSPHPSGYLHVTPPSARPLALPSNSREEEDMSNPSSSGGVGGGNGSKKRFRTRFTPEQKEKMLSFAERLGWRIQKQDGALVQQFCAEANVPPNVLKVWMHNNKHTLGKKT